MPPQFGVSTACFVEKRRALFRRAFKRRVKKLLHALPTFLAHGGSVLASSQSYCIGGRFTAIIGSYALSGPPQAPPPRIGIDAPPGARDAPGAFATPASSVRVPGRGGAERDQLDAGTMPALGRRTCEGVREDARARSRRRDAIRDSGD